MGTRHSLDAKLAEPDQLRELEGHFEIILKLISERTDGDRYVPIAERLETEIEARQSAHAKFDRYRALHAQRCEAQTTATIPISGVRSFSMGLAG